MAHTSVTIVLELGGTANSPAGRARRADGQEVEFHGWLRLAEAIDSLAWTSPDVMPVDRTPHPERSTT